MANNVFNVSVFFIVFREALEAVIVVSVLLAFLKRGLGGATEDPILYKKLVRQVWWGSISGVLVCLVVGGGFIGAFYSLGKDIWGNSEDLWEGIFSLIATIIISFMGIPMLRISKMQEKWRVKLARALISPPPNKKDRFKLGYLMKKHAMFLLPFITCLREGLEAVVFVGGAGLSSNQSSSAKAFPLAVICGLLAGAIVGFILYYGGATSSLQAFLIVSTCILYLIAAGLLSRAVWFFEQHHFVQLTGGDAAEQGSGPGSYDITKSVWHVNCCNPLIDNGWDVFNALLGWQNTATYGSVIAYNLYWIAVICILFVMLYEEKHGHIPFINGITLVELNPMYHIKNKKKNNLTESEKADLFERVKHDNILNQITVPTESDESSETQHE